MPINIGVLCSEEGLRLPALLETIQSGDLPAAVKIVVADRNSPALAIARSLGLFACYLPRSAFHANRDGFERRLTELLDEADVEAVVTADFMRETGPVLQAAFPDKIINLDTIPLRDLAGHLGKMLRNASLKLVTG